MPKYRPHLAKKAENLVFPLITRFPSHAGLRPDLEGTEAAPPDVDVPAARDHVRQRAPPASAAVKTASFGPRDLGGGLAAGFLTLCLPEDVLLGWISLISVDFL